MNPAMPLILHGLKLSGHVHRVELLLRMLDLPFEYALAPPEVRTSAAFKEKLNPLGQIPVLEDGELALADSCAILVYLCMRYAPGSSWLPEDPLGAASVQRWLSIAAGEVANGPAKARAMHLFNAPGDASTAAAIALRVMTFMEQHLESRQFLAAAHATIADLACYAYLAHAPEGGISLAPYPSLRAWLARVEALPGFVPMQASKLPNAS